ncbi:MAG: hypothetical protein K2O40_02450 [Lachnospiraceae bacterium]|nr:hypothetical protein [Lachnospiraceae bacterium]
MDNRKKKVLFIYEGIKAEETLLNNLVRVFFSSTADISILNCPADGNIYMLWTRLKKDEFETNVVDVLKEMSVIANERLMNFRASDFSEIYLFFDYDGHNDNIPKEYANQDILGEMLETFNNETELGKLYVSYPMIESIKDIDEVTRDYKNLYLPLDEISKYKQSFGAESAFAHYNCIDEARWLTACAASQKRASMLATFRNSCTYDYFIQYLNQGRLYFYQKQNYINNGHLLCILNSVPLFLLEYYEEDFWRRAAAG